MGRIKLLHCADIHMDAPFTSLGAKADKAALRQQDLRDTFDRIIDTAKAEGVDLLLISGDMYEHSYVKRSTINYINGRFGEIPEVEIFLVPGNHDPYLSNSLYQNSEWNRNVHILTSKRPCFVMERLQACVYGIGFEDFFECRSAISDIGHVNPEYVNILLIHGTVDMEFAQSAHNPVKSQDLSELCMDYIALGHFHNRIDDLGGYGLIYNPGSPEPLGFDEPGSHGAYIAVIEKDEDKGKQLDIRFVPLNKRFYSSIEVDVSGCAADSQVIRHVEAAVYKESGIAFNSLSDCILKVCLKGYLDKDFKLNEARILSYFADKLFYLKIENDTTPDYNFSELADETTLRGLFTRKIYALINKAQSDDERKRLMKALYYGLEALEQGKVDVG